MALERFDGVSGAARIITARRRKQGTERDLIGPYQQNEKRSHQVSLDDSLGPRSGEVNPGSGSATRHRWSCVITRSTSVASEAKGAW